MKHATLLLATLVIVLNQHASALTVVDAVNSSFTADNTDLWNVDDVGWLYTPPTAPYTPGATYTVTDLGTEFGTSSSNPVTVNIYENSNLPNSVGTLIASGTLTPVADQIVFASLNGGAGVTLDSGTQYVVAFFDVKGLGENIADDAGATTLDNWFYYNNNACMIGGGPNTGSHSKPILVFGNDPGPVSVPEPSQYALLLLGGVSLFAWRKFSRAGSSKLQA